MRAHVRASVSATHLSGCGARSVSLRAQILCAWQALASIGIAFLPYAGLYVMAPAIGAGFGATYALVPPAIADAFGERARSATVR